jgi:DNA modification methylase/predicted RNA-binding Zn-ribbon protein involved in translation (DUF1610 family)
MTRKNVDHQTRKIFTPDQPDMFEKSYEEELEEQRKQKVECLGMTFENDDARREHFLGILREKLKDPEFRQIEGFPIGEDEDILALSDPPYYTACPNPFIGDFIKHHGKPYDVGRFYSRETFSADVSEGKNNPIYNAHSYHTKVPHKALMRYILHYTQPGDLLLDCFCGTGMTGVAAQLCGDVKEIETLGYRVKGEGTVLDEQNNAISMVGGRYSILSDLSPIATFIARNYVDFIGLEDFEREALRVVAEIERSSSWLYKSRFGTVLSAIWSDVFLCPNCGNEIVFWETALKNGKLQKSFPCPNCASTVGKSASKITGAVKLNRAFDTKYDPVLNQVVRVPRFVLVQETVKPGSKRVNVNISDEERRDFAQRFDNRQWPAIPTDEFFPGRQTNKLINGTGISHICHMYTPRALLAYGKLWQIQLSSSRRTSLFRFCLSAINNYVSRKQGYFGGGGGVSGTLFTPSLHLERNVFDVLRRKIRKIGKLSSTVSRTAAVISTQSISDLKNIPNRAIDYIFTDPPFGESLQYSELNLFVEAWLRVISHTDKDCVLNYVHKKGLPFYSHMMASAFKEYERVLKPGRWITIEFHNSQNAVWSAIQQSIEASGLVVADVRVLDKQQRSFNAVNRAGAVDQDLVISAYKPNGGFEDRFKLSAGAEDGVWDFVRTHLKQLPVFISKNGQVEVIAERQDYLLFDRMVAFHVQRGVTVPLSAADFYAGLEQRFPPRDGMYFLPEQAVEYDKKRLSVKEVLQLQLFVTNESSAIQWLRQLLLKTPQTAGDLKPKFMQEIGGWQKHEKMLELDEILEQNFLRYNGKAEVPSQIHSYLSTNFKELRKERERNKTHIFT